jgi:orotate phosphoribosyltransferase
MQQKDRLSLLSRAGVLQEGHFKLTSGLHSDRYLQCARLFENPKYAEIVCRDIAQHFSGCEIDIVVGPAMGGIIMAYEVARGLGAKGIFAERENGAMTLRRGFSAPPGSRVLVVEDTVTTGGSVREVIELVLQGGAKVLGVGVVADRTGGRVDFGVEFYPFVSMVVQSYPPDRCPLCAKDIPITKPGSRQ